LFPVDSIAGVDYDEDDFDEDEDYDQMPELEDELELEEDFDDEDAFDRVDQAELDELMNEPDQEPDQAIRNNDNENNNEDEEQAEAEEQDDQIRGGILVTDSSTSGTESLRRSTRQIAPRQPSYAEEFQQPRQAYQKKVRFKGNVGKEHLEQYHNIDTSKDQKIRERVSYDYNGAMIAARLMTEIYDSVQKDVSFAQQYILQKGLRKFGELGSMAVKKELDQLHKRNCFKPINVSQLNSKETDQSRADVYTTANRPENGYQRRTPPAQQLQQKALCLRQQLTHSRDEMS
jgi:hypothetical protein